MDRTITEQVRTLMQGTEYGDEGLKQRMTAELAERLEKARTEGRPLRVYCGFDPRTSDLHIGHSVPMRKLRQFQDFGHDVSFVVGTYTACIGDPSDKSDPRDVLDRDRVRENGRTYAGGASASWTLKRTRVLFNDKWLASLSFG